MNCWCCWDTITIWDRSRSRREDDELWFVSARRRHPEAMTKRKVSAWQRFGGRHEAIWREDRELTRGSQFWRETDQDLLARTRHVPRRKC